MPSGRKEKAQVREMAKKFALEEEEEVWHCGGIVDRILAVNLDLWNRHQDWHVGVLCRSRIFKPRLQAKLKLHF